MADDEEFELALTEEKAVARIQAMAVRLLAAKNMTRVELAKHMGVSQSYISQLFADEPPNLSVRAAARLFHHLGERLEFSCEGVDRLNREAIARNAQKAAAVRRNESYSWLRYASNDEERLDSARELAAA